MIVVFIVIVIVICRCTFIFIVTFKPHFVDNRQHLINLIFAQDLIVTNTYFQKGSNKHKITYKAVHNTDGGPPWSPERFSELDYCLVRRHWRNCIMDVTSDPWTNVTTDHYALIIPIRQKLRAKETTEKQPTLKGLITNTSTQEEDNKQYNRKNPLSA